MDNDFQTASRIFWSTILHGDGVLLNSNLVNSAGVTSKTCSIPRKCLSMRKQCLKSLRQDLLSLGCEVTEMVKNLLSGRAMGLDKISLKAVDILTLTLLKCLCNVAWASGTLSLEWQIAVVYPVLKKGDQMMYFNYSDYIPQTPRQGLFRGAVAPACPGWPPGPSPRGTCTKHLTREASRIHDNQMPEDLHLAPFNTEGKWLYS